MRKEGGSLERAEEKDGGKEERRGDSGMHVNLGDRKGQGCGLGKALQGPGCMGASPACPTPASGCRQQALSLNPPGAGDLMLWGGPLGMVWVTKLFHLPCTWEPGSRQPPPDIVAELGPVSLEQASAGMKRASCLSSTLSYLALTQFHRPSLIPSRF